MYQIQTQDHHYYLLLMLVYNAIKFRSQTRYNRQVSILFYHYITRETLIIITVNTFSTLRIHLHRLNVWTYNNIFYYVIIVFPHRLKIYRHLPNTTAKLIYLKGGISGIKPMWIFFLSSFFSVSFSDLSFPLGVVGVAVRGVPRTERTSSWLGCSD